MSGFILLFIYSLGLMLLGQVVVLGTFALCLLFLGLCLLPLLQLLVAVLLFPDLLGLLLDRPPFREFAGLRILLSLFAHLFLFLLLAVTNDGGHLSIVSLCLPELSLENAPVLLKGKKWGVF